MKENIFFLTMLAIILALFGCSSETTQTSYDTEGKVQVGELHFAVEASPPSLDPHMSGAGSTTTVARHIFETLVTLDSKFEVAPMLAESWEISEDGKGYNFKLREGVKFHNGKELTAEDVVVSMSRWQDKAKKITLEGGKWKEKDKYTVTFEIENPSLYVLSELAGPYQFAAIMPKEVVSAATETGVEDFVGTGPFQFVEWKQDQHIHVAKYEDYLPIDIPSDGLAGKKEALVDDIYFQIVLDPSTRFAGVQTGEYDVGYGFEQDMFEQVESNPNMKAYNPFVGYTNIVFNKNEAPFNNIKMRQAVNAALDVSKIAKASLVDNYRLNSSYMQEEQANWFSEKGSEFYNNPNPAKAKALLKEAGYDREAIKLMTTRDYSYMYNSAVVIKEQLEAVGMKVELEVYDWPTVLSLESEPDKWDIEIMGFGTTTTPIEQHFFRPDNNYGPMDEKIEDLINRIKNATSDEVAKELWGELQNYSWEFLPIIKIADYTWLSASSDKVEGLSFFYGPILWNTKVID